MQPLPPEKHTHSRCPVDTPLLNSPYNKIACCLTEGGTYTTSTATICLSKLCRRRIDKLDDDCRGATAPLQIAARPLRPPAARNTLMRRVMIMAPLAPNGWPEAGQHSNSSVVGCARQGTPIACPARGCRPPPSQELQVVYLVNFSSIYSSINVSKASLCDPAFSYLF